METVNIMSSVPDIYEVRESFKALRTNLLFSGTDVKTVAITSSRQNEGKSLVCLELAKSLAEMGRKVLLLDVDLRKSVLAKKYTKEAGILGLSHHLAGHADRDEIVYQTQYETLYVVFSGPYPPNPVELISNNRFSDLVDYYKDIFDYIIIDTPPINLIIDAAIIASQCDGVVINIAANRASSKEIKDAKDQLERSGCHILGAILNMTEAQAGTGRRYYKRYEAYDGRSRRGKDDSPFIGLDRQAINK